jgi:hypothetical protein
MIDEFKREKEMTSYCIYSNVFQELHKIPLRNTIKNSICLQHGVIFLNEELHRASLLENKEIKGKIQGLLGKGHI